MTTAGVENVEDVLKRMGARAIIDAQDTRRSTRCNNVRFGYNLLPTINTFTEIYKEGENRIK